MGRPWKRELGTRSAQEHQSAHVIDATRTEEHHPTKNPRQIGLPEGTMISITRDGIEFTLPSSAGGGVITAAELYARETVVR